MKCIVFDLDRTLCALGEGIYLENIKKLKELESLGNYICICSGKPTYYLCGMFRQVGLTNPILIGENGAVIQFGVSLPPSEYYIVSKKKETIIELKKLRMELEEKFKDNLWFQPNEIALTPFPKEEKYFDLVLEDIKNKNINDILIYRHIDSIDIMPNDVNKYNGLKYLANILGLSQNDFIAVGDGINDYPMFDFAKKSIGINLADKSKVTHNFDDISAALDYLLENI